MSKDYYKILGVTEFDNAENIKIAYRKLARKWHPDVAGNSDNVLKMFKDINEAYEILSDSVKKEEYDRVRRFYSYAKGTAGETKTETHKHSSDTGEKFHNSYNQNPQKKTFFWEDFLYGKQRENTFKKEKTTLPKRGEDIYTEIDINIFESVRGAEKVINILQTGVCPRCEGRKFLNGTVCPHCNGKGETSEHKKFTVKIPAGIKNKSKIRLAGEGACGISGGANGDLYIIVNIKEPEGYKTEGLNIYKTISITPSEAVLGSDICISCISGTYNLKITPNTQNGQKIRLSGCGIVQNEKVGDMIITVEIRIPKNLSEEEIMLYKKLAKIREKNIGNSIYDK